DRSKDRVKVTAIEIHVAFTRSLLLSILKVSMIELERNSVKAIADVRAAISVPKKKMIPMIEPPGVVANT
ncbi:MAG TPA: hypothetical protein DDW93_10025, partial [Firmicutes bacterium]|nr:hypothetical protein [Bacillota bacterium]